jgi:hypothetical protein
VEGLETIRMEQGFGVQSEKATVQSKRGPRGLAKWLEQPLASVEFKQKQTMGINEKKDQVGAQGKGRGW